MGSLVGDVQRGPVENFVFIASGRNSRVTCAAGWLISSNPDKA
jgi:hypothetical protein